MSLPSPEVVWGEWCEQAKSAALQRWEWLCSKPASAQQMDAKGWFGRLKTRLVRLEEIGILDYRESQRLKIIFFAELSRPDQDRLRRNKLVPKHIVSLALAPSSQQPGQSPVERSLRFRDGACLRDGALGLQVLIDEHARRAIGMNIQLRGFDPRAGHRVYLRYDLDIEQMGLGPVSHFSSHWHHGTDPDDPGSEDYDPRMPSPLLDPVEALEFLVETFFPQGPASLAQEDG